jgi:predicted GTPase
MNASTAIHEKKIDFNHFVNAYQDFNGYVASIHNVIQQYHDLFVLVCNEIDPINNNNNKEETFSECHQSYTDTDYRRLLAAIKRSLLHRNIEG